MFVLIKLLAFEGISSRMLNIEKSVTISSSIIEETNNHSLSYVARNLTSLSPHNPIAFTANCTRRSDSRRQDETDSWLPSSNFPSVPFLGDSEKTTSLPGPAFH